MTCQRPRWCLKYLSKGETPSSFSLPFVLPPLSNASGGDKSSSGQSALVQWSEVSQHPGIVCALTQSNNPVVLLVRPEVLQVHELKPLPVKSRIQGFVVVRQPTSPGESVSVYLDDSLYSCCSPLSIVLP